MAVTAAAAAVVAPKLNNNNRQLRQPQNETTRTTFRLTAMRESTKLFKIIISAGRELFEFQPAANAINMRAAATVVATV